MTKNDLKTGMFVKIIDGRIYFVLRDTGMNETTTTAKDILINFTNIKYDGLSGTHEWLSLANYNEDLTFHTQYSSENIFNICLSNLFYLKFKKKTILFYFTEFHKLYCDKRFQA